jgi:uracil-DNA glycosylase family protein
MDYWTSVPFPTLDNGQVDTPSANPRWCSHYPYFPHHSPLRKLHPMLWMNLFDPSPRSALEFLPSRRDLISLSEAAKVCRGCDLYQQATQVVFGEGHPHSPIFLVGEQPGDREDQQGKPFVGPAGMLLDKCLESAGIDRTEVYVTNAVKHFKWEPRGKIRLHKKPNSLEIAACRPWLDAEIDAVRPRIIVCLGATAAQDLLGPQFRLTKHRGEVFPTECGPVTATIHPSAILRMPEPGAKDAEMASLIDDLKMAAQYAAAKRAL